MNYFLQIVSNGLHNGMLYAVLAYGYALTFMITRRANIAHGALFAFSAQVFVIGVNFAYVGLVWTFATALLFGGAMALSLTALALTILAVSVFPRIAHRGPNMMVAVSLAVALVLLEAARIGASARDFWLPPVLAEAVPLLPGPTAPTLTLMQIVNIAAMATALGLCEFVYLRGRGGRALRAMADDPTAAALFGVDPKRAVSVATLLGGGLASFAGLLAVLHFGNMSFGSGFVYGLKVLFIASVGGLSRPAAVAGGAFLFGEAEALWDGYFPIATREMVFFVFLAALLCLRPGGRVSIERV